ncbi:MAG: TonB-dependent receptor [Candidatus Loosdrechtia sp.]|uniref:TonB-dependent receptor n=1 Tax=Candidatus Loosdrechtia sp. TaxID=3101272 RepID=UPI003A62A6EE|nr:MAG: TonB-dependent receptor [Candidatus Jettenia sp. AMX2]
MFGYLNKREEVVEPETYLRDTNGNPVYAGNVDFQGRRVNVFFQGADKTFLEDFHYGLTLNGRIGDAWRLTTTGSFYDLTGTRPRSGNVDAAGSAPATGMVTRQDGTGWFTYDIKIAHESEDRPLWLGQRSIFGYHFDNYFRREVTHNAADWRREILTTINTISAGKTMTHALFLENTWLFADDQWELTLGGRQEFWKAYDGFLLRGDNRGRFDSRTDEYFSPKASLAWFPTKDWEARFSTGLAKRFPMVDELFLANFDNFGRFDPDTFDPNLKPEKSFSRNLSVIRGFEKGRIIASIFNEDIDDSILRQPNAFSGVTHYQNVDKVRNWGGELAFESHRLFLEDLSFYANISYVDAKIVRNSGFPETKGNRMPQIPKWRVNSFLTYHVTEQFDWSFGMRYASDMFHQLDNADGGRGGMGFTDSYLVFDTKLAYKIGKGFSASFGVDNLTGETYYISHPYPGRTYLFDLNWKL